MTLTLSLYRFNRRNGQRGYTVMLRRKYVNLAKLTLVIGRGAFELSGHRW